jgi:membrane fusion protein, multidrug efflux system
VQVLRDTPNGTWLAGLPDTANVIVVGQEFTSDGATVDVVWRDSTEAAQ